MRGSGISVLRLSEGLEACEELDARDNAIQDASPLLRCVQLQILLLGRNQLAKFGPLNGLSRLTTLDVSDNRLRRVDLRGLPSLQCLNVAGNEFDTVECLAGIGTCRELATLDLSRNRLAELNPLLDQLRDLPLKLLSVLGNPCMQNFSGRIDLPLVVWNGRTLPGCAREADELLGSVPPAVGILWSAETGEPETPAPLPPSRRALAAQERARPISHPRSGPTDSVSSMPAHTLSLEDTAEGGAGPAASSPAGHASTAQASTSRAISPHDSAADAENAERRPPHGIMDSADDMTSGGRTPQSSASESGAAYGLGTAASATLPGLADRQDSANYQPRPPALAERQDSAQNLQALAEAEAELAGGGDGQQPAMARQDSARELDGSVRSPASPLSLQGVPSGRGSLGRSLSFELRGSGVPPTVSPRQDSASDREAHHGLTLGSARSGSMPTARAADGGAEAGGLDATPTASLEAARLLHISSVLTPARSERTAEPSTFLDTFDSDDPSTVVRQDSALDSLAEARRAVLADLPHGASGAMPSSDPLQQARHMLHSNILGTGSGSRSPLERSMRPGSPPPRTLLGPRLGGATGAGPPSPFDRPPVTPLSPRWTASQLPGAFLQPLPRIASGVPWTPPGGNPGAPTVCSDGTGQPPDAQPGPLDAPRGGLLEEARRAVLGSPDPSQSPESSRAAAKRAGPPLPPQPSALAAAVEGSAAAADRPPAPQDDALPGRGGEGARDTPYPDSPLAAGAEGSRADFGVFQRQGSLRAVAVAGSGEEAECSSAAAGGAH